MQNVVVSFVGKKNGIRYAADTALPLVSETPVLGDLAMITRARNAFQKRRGVGFHFRPRSAYRDESPHNTGSPHNNRSHNRR